MLFNLSHQSAFLLLDLFSDVKIEAMLDAEMLSENEGRGDGSDFTEGENCFLQLTHWWLILLSHIILDFLQLDLVKVDDCFCLLLALSQYVQAFNYLQMS